MPIAARPRDPIGLITTPAELRNTKALADLGVEPSRTAVRKLLDDADDGLAFTPCALAHYTSEAGADCLADVWGALRGHYWNCPADGQALAARRLGGDWR